MAQVRGFIRQKLANAEKKMKEQGRKELLSRAARLSTPDLPNLSDVDESVQTVVCVGSVDNEDFELFYAGHTELFHAGHNMEGLSAFIVLLGFGIICWGSVRF